MNDLKVFSNTEFGELGILVIGNKEYFPATQCARLLGYEKPQNAILRHCKGSLKQGVPTNGGVQQVNYISEGDLYRLIVSSKLPAAEKFERWIFDEVLPTVRKNGGYINNAEELIAKTAMAVVSEVMKQILPIISKSSERPRIPTEEIWEYDEPIKRRKSPVSIISRLDDELRSEVEEMIMSGKYTYEEIRDYLGEFGVRLSCTSVWRYAKRLTRI